MDLGEKNWDFFKVGQSGENGKALRTIIGIGGIFGQLGDFGVNISEIRRVALTVGYWAMAFDEKPKIKYFQVKY